ncbi:MAG: hypothetical protein CVU89_11730 [Firmicutes bacterium HGW-Firmicutes-14]|nr:MAG: hypothetical protein CVU89_11730 [Firmicutes bacterium HGW-Firmicutes-14]
MTVGDKMHQTLSSLESAAASLKTFAVDTQDKNAQQMFNDLSGQLDNICNSLRGRVNYIEEQEPQYKISQQQQQKQ